MALGPGVGGRRGAAGRPGSGVLCPGRDALPPPNNALEPTAPMGACTHAAVRPWRGGSARAFGGPRGGGWRRVVATRSGVARWLAGQGARAGRRWPAGCRRAPWEWGAVSRARRAPPTEQRTGADRANGSLYSCGSPSMARRLTASVRWPTRLGVAEGSTHEERGGAVAGGTWRSGRVSEACGAPPGALGAGRVARAGRPTPTEQRTGADRATGGLSPAAVRTWRGGSARALAC